MPKSGSKNNMNARGAKVGKSKFKPTSAAAKDKDKEKDKEIPGEGAQSPNGRNGLG